MQDNELWKAEVVKVNAALAEYLDSKIQQVSEYAPWHKEYYENVKEYLMRGGKRLRPVLVALGYKAIKDEVEVEHLYRAACSVEILHNGSLLHDDLIDHDETRRGGPTFHARYRDWYKKNAGTDQQKADDFGMTMAILGGDSLINMGAEVISASGLEPDVGMQCQVYYQTAFQELVDGVLLEMAMIKDPDTTSETYLQMVRMKTAVLFDKSLLIGAAMARANESQIAALSEFGVKVGQAFQLQDDILGSFGDEKVTGKPADGDIREAKKTMLVIEAYKRATKEQKNLLDSLLGKHDMTNEEVEEVRSVFKESGAYESTQSLMDRLLTEGQKALDKADPPIRPVVKEFLLKLSDFLVARTY